MNRPERPPGYVPRMRIASRIVTEIKKLDPGTDITVSLVRRLVYEGKVTALHVGQKALINLDDVLDIAAAGTDPPEPIIDPNYGIRPVDVHNPMGR